MFIKDSDAYLPSSEDNLKWAEDNGLVNIFPEDNQLLLDFDNSVDYDYFEQEGVDILRQFWGVKKIETKPSASGKLGHLHVRVTLAKNITQMERLALQAALGSDRKRELLGIAMTNAGDPHPTFFSQKETGKWKQA